MYGATEATKEDGNGAAKVTLAVMLACALSYAAGVAVNDASHATHVAPSLASGGEGCIEYQIPKEIKKMIKEKKWIDGRDKIKGRKLAELVGVENSKGVTKYMGCSILAEDVCKDYYECSPGSTSRFPYSFGGVLTYAIMNEGCYLCMISTSGGGCTADGRHGSIWRQK